MRKNARFKETAMSSKVREESKGFHYQCDSRNSLGSVIDGHFELNVREHNSTC